MYTDMSVSMSMRMSMSMRIDVNLKCSRGDACQLHNL
jgi:hypothetical protein